MRVGKSEFPNYLFKVCEKEEFIDQLLAGKLYMKESGYFRKLEDGYRGDPFDGRKPLEIGDTEVYLEAEDGERIYLNGVPGVFMQNLSFGFSGDDKLPIFCACIMDEKMIDVTGPHSFRIKKEYLNEMKKFGKYVLLISYEEIIDKLNEYVENHNGVAFHAEKVKYTDIMSEYQASDLEETSWKKDIEAFFVKDEKYKYQNEWRILAYANEAVMSANNDLWIWK